MRPKLDELRDYELPDQADMTQTATPQSRFQTAPRAKVARKVRRIVNMRLLSVSLIVAVCGGLLTYMWHRRQERQVAATLLQRAATLEQQEKWPEAAGYLTRYLQVKPDDSEARLQLIKAIEKSTDIGAGRYRLVSLLYQTLGIYPDREDLRLQLAQILLDSQNFADAKKQADQLLKSSVEANQIAARRIIALSQFAQARPGGIVSIAEAATALEAALHDNPGDVDVASLLAEICRQYPEQVGAKATAAHADEIMNQLVLTNEKNADAHVARYRYQLQYHPDQARADLKAALAIDPDHIQALLLDMDAAIASQDSVRIDAAKASGERIISQWPQDPRGYMGVARLYAAGGNRDSAIATLKAGRNSLQTVSLELDYLLASLLIEAGQHSDAKEVAGEFSREVDIRLPEMTTAGRIKLENMQRLLKARLAIAANDLPAAQLTLDAIITSTGKASDFNESFEAMVAHDLLASILSKQGRVDLAAEHWKAIAELQPGFQQAAWRAGMAELEMGRPDAAVEQIEAYLKLPDALPDAWMALVQAHLQNQLRRPIGERSWTEFLNALDQARTRLPNRWDWQLAEVLYLVSQPGDAEKEQARQRLLALETAFPQDRVLCERLVLMLQKLGMSEDVERLLKRYDELQPNIAHRAMLRSTILVANMRAPDALRLLNETVTKADNSDRRDLTLFRLRLLIGTQQFAEAQELAAKAIAELPQDLQLLVNGIEVALLRKQFDDAAKWEQALASVVGPESFDCRYYRARRLVLDYDHLDADQRTQLGELIESLRLDRPAWFPVVTLGAQFAAAQGNTKAAIESYRAAFNAGDRRQETLEQFVRALYADGQFDEAARYLSLAKSDESSAGRQESMAIVAAIHGNRIQEAREMATRAVERGSQDPLHYVWLANLSHAEGDQQNAEAVFRTALKKFPKEPRVWNALFTYFVQSNKPDRARQTLEHWTKQVPMSGVQALLIKGQGNESLGDPTAALEFYRQAVAIDANDATARYLYAKSLAPTDASQARSELDQLLQKNPSHADAQQLLATLLAATGDPNDWAHAVELLKQGEASESDSNSGNSERLRAMLLSRQGKNKQERQQNYIAAQQILLARLQKSDNPTSNIDRMLLASIYEQEAKIGDPAKSIQSARETLLPIIDRPDVSADQLLSYIQLLLRNLAPSDVAKGRAPQDPAFRKVLAEDARVRIADLEELLAKQPSSERRFLPVALQIKLLEAEGNNAQGLKALDEFVERELERAASDADRGKILLQAGNLCSSIGEFQAAEAWYRDVEKIAPNSYVLVAQSLLQQGKTNEAIQVCLPAAAGSSSTGAATVLAQVLSQILSSGKTSDPELVRQALEAVNQALDADRGNVDLLMSMAVFHVTRNDEKRSDSDEAIRLFRRVVKLRPKHVLALNNLATMLAERPDQLGEAQQYIEIAIKVAGRQPALLDTLGTILIRSQQYKPAIAALEEATAGTTNDPRYYFHLAAAYDGDGRAADAQRTLKTAIDLGLDKAILTGGDRELLASLKHDLLTANTPE
jgi:predicted Zn-dependent protease